jgi:hypothetical protein
MGKQKKIFTAKDYSSDEGADGTVIDRLKKMRKQWKRRGFDVQMGEAVNGEPVNAEINQGAWIARCACGGAEFVDVDEPVFFCWSCMNRNNNGNFLPVIFPPKADIKKIEKALLKREVDDLRGMRDKDRAYNARPKYFYNELPLTVSWIPGETAEDIEAQTALAIGGK